MQAVLAPRAYFDAALEGRSREAADSVNPRKRSHDCGVFPFWFFLWLQTRICGVLWEELLRGVNVPEWEFRAAAGLLLP